MERIMNASTLTTRTNLIDLSRVGTDHVLSYYVGGDDSLPHRDGFRDYRDRGNILSILRSMGPDSGRDGRSSFRYYWTLEAAATYNEAVIENAHHDALVMNTSPGAAIPVNREAQAEAVATMRRREAQAIADRDELERTVRELRAQVNKLQAPVTSGSDPRLESFWELAADAADEAGFCPEYDKIAEAMGGTPRETEIEYDVELTITTSVTVSVTAGRNFDPNQNLSDYIDLYSIQQSANVTWGDIEIEDYNRS